MAAYRGQSPPPYPGQAPAPYPGQSPAPYPPDTRGDAARAAANDKDKKKTLALMVGDPVHFAVQDGGGKGPTRHGSLVLFVDGDRALLASSPDVPNVKVVEVGTDRVGMSWVKTQYLGKGHKNCASTLTLSTDAAWSLRSKILLTAGDVNEQVVLSGRGSASNTSNNSSGLQSPNLASPGEFGDMRPQDRELRAMVKEALSSFKTPDAPEAAQDPVKQLPPPVRQHDHTAGAAVDPNMSRDLRALILEAFDEGLQALRYEQQKTDRWVSVLQERVNKVTGHFLMSWGSRLESEMDRRLNLYSDTIRTTCESLQSLQQPGSTSVHASPAAAPHAMVSATVPAQHAPRQEMIPRTLTEKSSDKGSHGVLQRDDYANAKRMAGSENAGSQHSMGTSSQASSTAASQKAQHTMAMIDKIRKDHARSDRIRKAVATNCGAYSKDCIPRPLVQFVHSPHFNHFCAAVTLCFAIMVGVEVDIGIRYALEEEDSPSWVGQMVSIFNIWFAAEVIIRIIADGVEYFLGDEWRWNCFDVVLVLLSVLDMVSDTGQVGFMRLVRAFKLMKALRVVRVLRLFHELRLMVAQMLLSLGSLFWSMVFLAVIVYLTAVALVQAATTYIKETSRTNFVAADISEYYCHLFQAMYVLLCSITGGIDWQDAALPVWHCGWMYGCGFMFFVLVSILGILNIVTSVFVERASNMKRLDKDFAISEELRIMERDIEDTMNLFNEICPEESSIASAEFSKMLRDEHVIAHFSTIGIDVSDASKFEHLIAHEEGVVNIHTFVIGCVSLRGAAKQSDTLSIFMALEKLEKALTKQGKEVDDAMRRMTGLIHQHGSNGMPHGAGAMSPRDPNSPLAAGSTDV